jgi:hypothetical protein
MITGSVSVELRDAAPEVAHRRVACLPMVPTGVRVIVEVGALAPNPHVVRLLREHVDRLHIDIHGTEHAVRRWVAALRTGDVLSGELPLGVTA